MKRREFVGAGLAFAAAWPLRGWSAVLKNVGDVAAKSLDGADITLRGSSIEAFAASLRGDVLLAGSPDYDDRRRVWNGSFDKHPALIASCTGASDVRHAVDFAREHQLLTAVRAGGHSLSGKSTCDGGLVIDLQQMQGVRVDPEAKRAYLEAGSLLGQLDHECTRIWPRDRGGHGVRHRRRGPHARRRIWPRRPEIRPRLRQRRCLRRRHGRWSLFARERRREHGSLLGPSRRRRQLRRRDGHRVPPASDEPDDSRWVRRMADGPGA